jgi:diketogulonate reductase-like aldo/keto reductase
LGVANFGVHHLEALAKLGLEKPSVNQIQIHPWHQNKDIVKYCQENDIAVMGYSPLAKAKKIDDITVAEIARK